MKPYYYHTIIRLLVSVFLLLVLSSTLPAPAAEANYFNDLYNGLQQFSELPDEVNQLQESYQQTVEELEKTKNELGETKDQLGQTIEDMESYRSENTALIEQNLQLTKAVDQLRDERAARESYLRKIKITIYTGLGLLVGYFLLIRLIRFGMRRRSRKGDRFR
ncbi:hypothetical protein [Paenibacillus wynnii]|uniref:hypothetical protein n=1 Tax=Paenibacillus wynnii TaxID=268407 RepID=UPI0027926DBD|nr:hypothetical protein [Paenibacillus wynnii]MDQ0193972.1 septal ring factor EnvC (AmiA/AmiB activator) [Paenibacillus wynnii]